MADVRKLPQPVAEIWEWQIRGSCRGMNSDLFFHPERERGSARTEREARAKMVCRGCAVIRRCRDHALAVHEPYGVWGGLSVAERDEQIRAGALASTVIDVDFTDGRRGRSRPGSAPRCGKSDCR
jgi:WhiB family transcriptional regulator, redox-sensing transcriptional regulator